MVKRLREVTPPPSTSATASPSSTIADPSDSSPGPIEAAVHPSKYLQVSSVPSQASTVMKCSLPPHQETLVFSTFENFEEHYLKDHSYRCSECRKNFPTNHFLELHIGENHDPINEVRRAKGEKTVYLSHPLTDIVCGAVDDFL